MTNQLLAELEALQQQNSNLKTSIDEGQEIIVELQQRFDDLLEAHKIQEEILEDKEKRLDKANYILEQILVISDKDHEGQYRPVKNTSKRDIYKAIVMLNEILGDKE